MCSSIVSFVICLETLVIIDTDIVPSQVTNLDNWKKNLQYTVIMITSDRAKVVPIRTYVSYAPHLHIPMYLRIT